MVHFNIRYFFLILIAVGCGPDIIPIPQGLIEKEVFSKETDDTYLIRIHLPKSYNDQFEFPVLYQLDGATSTGSVIESYNELIENNLISEFIIVTIDYELENNRVRDFTPTAHPNFDSSGGAILFKRFLQNELIPYVNQTYRTSNSNTLRGHSLGGLFASHLLLDTTSTKVFSNYIIESPSWWWDNNYSIGQEFEYAQKFDDLDAHAYFSVGEYEPASMKGPFTLVKDRLLSRNYAQLETKFEILSNMGHLKVRNNERGIIEIFGND